MVYRAVVPGAAKVGTATGDEGTTLGATTEVAYSQSIEFSHNVGIAMP